jgi:hypothetical protein
MAIFIKPGVCADYPSAGSEDDKEEPVPRSAHGRPMHG